MLDGLKVFPNPPPVPDLEPDLRVGFILAPRFTLLAFASFIDCLRLVADESDFSRQVYCHWKVIGPTLDPVIASCGIEIRPDSVFPDPSEFDYVVVVGGLVPDCLELSDTALEYLRQAYEMGVSVIGLCTGSFILGKAGLLDGRRCAVHSNHAEQMVSLFPSIEPESDALYINDNGIITCLGGTSSIDFVFSLIEAHCGKARMQKGLSWLLVDKHRTSDDMPHIPQVRLLSCGNRHVEEATQWMLDHLDDPCSVGDIASRFNTSERELNRLFTQHAGAPPTAVWRSMRLAHGHWLLLNTSRNITQIAFECGFSDGAHFSRWFRKTYNESPVEFRNRRRSN